MTHYTVTTILMLTILGLSGCEDRTHNQVNDELLGADLMNEKVQVMSDISLLAQQALTEAYKAETGVQVEWFTPESLLDSRITAKVNKEALIVPKLPAPVDPKFVTVTNSGVENSSIASVEAAESNLEAINPETVTSEVISPEAVNTEAVNLREASDTITPVINIANKVAENESDEDTIHASQLYTVNDSYQLPVMLDVLLLHSVYDMQEVARHNQLQSIASDILLDKIPEAYQDPEGNWYGLSQYGRTTVYHQDHVNAKELMNYAHLAAEKWQQRLCLSDYELPDNQAILHTMRAYRGESRTREALTGWLENLSIQWRNKVLPQELSDDIVLADDAVLKAIEAGYCDVGIVNSDSFISYAATNPNTPIRLEWVNQFNRGTVTNVISAGISRNSEDTEQALAFIEWLTSDNGQALLSFYTHTFPLISLSDPSIDMNSIRPKWTKFSADPTRLADIFENVKKPELATR